MQRFERSMRMGHLFNAAILAASIAGLAAPASAQMVAGPPPGGLHTFSPVTGAQPFGNAMSAQQMQMAQMYMLYGMMSMGRGNVSTGVANPFVNGGFGMQGAGNPYLESPTDYGASSNRHGAHANRDELRAQRAEQQRQAKLAKANAAALKAAAKVKGKKKAAGVE